MTEKILFVVLAGLVIAACDSAPIDDGMVTVRYELTSTTGGSALIRYLGEGGDLRGGRVVQAGWAYSFRAEPGSQQLYITTSEVQHGNVEARIYVDGTLIRSYVHEDPQSNAIVSRGIGAWG